MAEQHGDNLAERSTEKSYLELGLYPLEGDRVKVIRLINAPKLQEVDSDFLDNRNVGATGTITEHVTGMGIELVEHDDTHQTGAYTFAELTPLEADKIVNSLTQTL